jgi:hypothetical protein
MAYNLWSNAAKRGWAMPAQLREKKGADMQKDKAKDQEQKRKSRRLSLNRETIRSLNDPALLELARGGRDLATSSQPGGMCETIPSAAGGC